MENTGNHRITTVEQLRTIYGHPNRMVSVKLLSALDDTAVDFIRHAPFLVLGTSDAEGNLDVSPKGDAPGFVTVEDRNTLLIPDRRGNKLLFTFQNIIANPQVALIFMVPGTEETLRVAGVAELSADPALLERFSARGVPAQLVIRITVRECFFHCAKAFLRSQLWEPASWGGRISFSWGKYLAAKSSASDDLARKIDSAVADDYKNNL